MVNPDPVAYRLTNTGYGSHKYGACEVCDRHADSVYILTQMRRFLPKRGGEGITHHKCFTLFGHRKCLVDKTILISPNY